MSSASEVFIDSGGLFAALVKGDPAHSRARRFMAGARTSLTRFVTTDYVLDEAATLFKARGHGQLAAAVFEITWSSAACRIEWTGPSRFEHAKRFFFQYDDHGYSFTDCVSFVVMSELGLTKAFATDRHFVEAGFELVLS